MSKMIYSTPDEVLKATDEFYLNREGFQYTEEYVTSWIKKYLTLPVSGRVLDLCCGDGIWSKGMQNVNPNLELYGIDISQRAISEAKKIYANISFFNHDLQKEPFKQKFQTVFAFDVIEHVFDTNSFIENIYLTLNKGGYLLLTVPNVLGLRNRIKPAMVV